MDSTPEVPGFCTGQDLNHEQRAEIFAPDTVCRGDFGPSQTCQDWPTIEGQDHNPSHESKDKSTGSYTSAYKPGEMSDPTLISAT